MGEKCLYPAPNRLYLFIAEEQNAEQNKEKSKCGGKSLNHEFWGLIWMVVKVSLVSQQEDQKGKIAELIHSCEHLGQWWGVGK